MNNERLDKLQELKNRYTSLTPGFCHIDSLIRYYDTLESMNLKTDLLEVVIGSRAVIQNSGSLSLFFLAEDLDVKKLTAEKLKAMFISTKKSIAAYTESLDALEKDLAL